MVWRRAQVEKAGKPNNPEGPRVFPVPFKWYMGQSKTANTNTIARAVDSTKSETIEDGMVSTLHPDFDTCAHLQLSIFKKTDPKIADGAGAVLNFTRDAEQEAEALPKGRRAVMGENNGQNRIRTNQQMLNFLASVMTTTSFAPHTFGTAFNDRFQAMCVSQPPRLPRCLAGQGWAHIQSSQLWQDEPILGQAARAVNKWLANGATAPGEWERPFEPLDDI